MIQGHLANTKEVEDKEIVKDIYYSKFAKGQNFNFVRRRSCVSDTKSFMIDM